MLDGMGTTHGTAVVVYQTAESTEEEAIAPDLKTDEMNCLSNTSYVPVLHCSNPKSKSYKCPTFQINERDLWRNNCFNYVKNENYFRRFLHSSFLGQLQLDYHSDYCRCFVATARARSEIFSMQMIQLKKLVVGNHLTVIYFGIARYEVIQLVDS